MVKAVSGLQNVNRNQRTVQKDIEGNNDFNKTLKEKKGEKILDSFLEDAFYIKEDKEVITLEDLERAYQITSKKIDSYLDEIYDKYDLKDSSKAELKIRGGEVVVDNNK